MSLLNPGGTYKYQQGGDEPYKYQQGQPTTNGTTRKQLKKWRQKLFDTKKLLDQQRSGIESYIIPDQGGTKEQRKAFKDLWESEDLMPVVVPYKGRTGTLGYVPKSMAPELVKALSNNKDLRGKISVLPTRDMAPETYAWAKELQKSGKPITVAQAREFSKRLAKEAGAGFSVDWPIMIKERHAAEAAEQYKASLQGDPGYGDAHDPGPGKELVYKGGDLIGVYDTKTGKTSGFGGTTTYGGEFNNWLKQMRQPNLNFNVRIKEYDRAVYYEMPNILKQLKNSYATNTTKSYQAEKEKALGELQEYIDKYQESEKAFLDSWRKYA